MNTLLGTKRGMTQLWRENGTRVPVTVLDVAQNTVTGIRTLEKDGYEAVQIGSGAIRPFLVSKPRLGQFQKAGLESPVRHVREVRCEVGDVEVGAAFNVDLFEVGGFVDVVGSSKGKGFAGTIKRHGFARGPVTHGSQNVRRPGSIGMCKYPGRVIRGKRMAGRMGNERVTVKGLEILAVDAENGQLLVKGPVPGANGGLVLVRSSNLVQTKSKKGGK
ncbi:MAG: 50S ribosomal protein L3 [Planctomycetota bacterium]|nr:50S ribosomal protein L3 [Planctomycetota bacterium]